MATTQAIDATIFASSHPDIAKRTSVSGVLISSVMLVVGVYGICFHLRTGRQIFDSQYGFNGSRNRAVSYGYFPAILEIKRGGLFTDRQCCKRT